MSTFSFSARFACFFFLFLVSNNAISATLYLTQEYRASIQKNGSCGIGCTFQYGNYFTGWTGAYPYREYRSFYIFDLSSVSQEIVAAEFRFTRGSTFADYGVYDYTGDIAALPVERLPEDALGQAIFADLGSGVSYGAFSFNSPYYLDTTSGFLNAAGLVDLNAARGEEFAMGVAVHNLDEGGKLGGSSAGTDFKTELILTTVAIPVPPAIWLFGSALGLLGWIRRKAS